MSPLLDLHWGGPLLRDARRAWELCTSSILAATVHVGPVVTPLWVLPQPGTRAFSLLSKTRARKRGHVDLR
jgi:hypothetical protein